MHSRKWILLTLLILGVSAISGFKTWANTAKESKVDAFVLTHDKLLDLLKKNPPSLNKLKAATLGEKLNAEQIKDKFQWQAEASAYHERTTEGSFAPYIPVTSPIDRYEAGVKKRLQKGMQVQAKAFSYQSTNNAVTRGTEAGVALAFSMDLHRDFLGKLSEAEITEAALASRKTNLKNKIEASAFEQEAQKLFWSLVANQEKLNVSRQLLKTSKEQAEDARERYRNNITDRGEVARYESQVAAREADIVYLEYVRSNTIRSLKELFPEISDKNIVLGDYEMDQTVNKVLSCTEQISSKKRAPFEYTYYDEILKLSKSQYQMQKNVTEQYDTWDLSLDSEVRALGKQAGYTQTFDQLKDDNSTAYNVALQFTLPLDSKKTTTEDVKKELEKKRYIAEQEELQGKIHSFHTQTIESIGLLQKVVRNQSLNADKLSESLEVTRKKYSQARISFREVIRDQDSLLESHLNEIDTKLTVIQTLLDYFSVFNQTPCEINFNATTGKTENLKILKTMKGTNQ